MKKVLFLLLANCVIQGALAQNCGNPQSSIDIEANNVRARILGAGDLFNDLGGGGQFIPNPGPPGTPLVSTMYAAGIWMGGIDPAGNLKLAAVDYRSASQRDYSAGPLTLDGQTNANTCANWDRHFRVTESEISGFLAETNLTIDKLKTLYRGVAGWPAKGNPYFSDIWGFDLPFSNQSLAPFFDKNSNGLYDPFDGDYPVVHLRGYQPFVPTEIIWCVFNDAGSPHSNSGGQPLKVEVQLTTWAFKCSNQTTMNNAIFTSHKIINRATEPLDSMFVAIWADVDLGCQLDDYVGCDTVLHTMYAYNQDAVDGSPGTSCPNGPATFGGTPPTQSVTLLNHSLDKFIPYNNGGGAPPGSTDPATALEFYRYLSGSWRDGSPLTYGGMGYGGPNPTVNHLYSDSPENVNGWSMCTANIAASDRRLLGCTKIGTLVPGQVEEVNTAWAFHTDPDLPCDVGTTFSDVKVLRAAYDNGFSDVCSIVKAPDLPADSVEMFPNPAASQVLLRYGALRPQALRVFDAAGKLMLEKTGDFGKNETSLPVSTLAAGIYTVQLVTDQGALAKKLVVAR